MRIAINALSARGGGGISVLVNTLPIIARLDQKNSYTIFCSSRQQELVSGVPANFRKVIIDYIPSNPFVRVFWEQFVLPFYLLFYKINVLYSVGNITSILAPCKIILLIENANPFSRIGIQWSPRERLRNKLLYYLGWLSAWRATKVRFISENSKSIITRRLRIRDSKCVMLPHGCQLDHVLAGEDSQARPYERNYILTVGANAPHRNICRLIEAFALLVNEYGYTGDLVLLGNIGSLEYKEALDQAVARSKMDGRIICKGEIPHGLIKKYYRHADALVFPSIEETFGIPLIEAMAIGVPIAASDCELEPAYRGKCFNPFREICGNAAEYFNPFDQNHMAAIINQIIHNPVQRESLMQKGKERVAAYNITTTVQELIKIFETVGY